MRIAVQNESGLVIEGPTSIPIKIETPREYYPIQSYVTAVL